MKPNKFRILLPYAVKGSVTFSLSLVLSLLMACGGGGGSAQDRPMPSSGPQITVQPVATAIEVGQTATFRVTATGDGLLEYQWLRDGVPIQGGRAPVYTTPICTPTDDGTVFQVLIADLSGSSVSSEGVRLDVLAGTRRVQHYVDPVNGSDLGDGSSEHPWRNLQDVIHQHVESRTWEGPLPYTEGQSLVPVHSGAAVRSGDTIWLRSGEYGAITIQGLYNGSSVTLAAQSGHTPRFTNVQMRSCQNWVLRGWTVSPSFGLPYSAVTIVTIENHNWQGPAFDVVIDGFEIYSVQDESVWTTREDWDSQAASAVNASGDRITIRNCRIRNVDFGISMSGRGSRVEHNTIDGFAGDGLRGLGDDEVFEYNLVKNRRDVNDNHPDGFQSWSVGPEGVGTGVVRNIALRGNTIIGYEDPAIPFIGTLQGIGCFDGFYDGWVVENNVIITDHWHGISFYGARNTRIRNNTVLDLNALAPGPPWTMVTAHKSGEPSRNCIVRNNLTTALNVSGEGNEVDHNLLLPLLPVGYFVDLTHHDVHLAAGSPAIDQGSSEQAPAEDADGSPRPQGLGMDVGAYEYRP